MSAYQGIPPASSLPRSVLDFETEDALAQALQEAMQESLQVSATALKKDCRSTLGSDRNSLDHEVKRLKALKSFMILDSEEEAGFNRATAKLRSIYDVSWSGLSFVDLGRQWFKSFDRPDIDVKETARPDSFCAYVIDHLSVTDVLVVPDTLEDERFCNNSRVTGFPHFRFYAGAPLVTPGGHMIGTVCLLDRKPRPQGLSDKEKDLLRRGAAAMMQQLVRRRSALQGRKLSIDAKRGRTSSFSSSSPRRSHSDDYKRLRSLGSVNAAIDLASSDESISSSIQFPTLAQKTTDAVPIPAFDKKAQDRSSYAHHSSFEGDRATDVIPKPLISLDQLPDPQISGVDPDQYLVSLVNALTGADLKVKPANELENFFMTTTDVQMAAYNLEIVTACRENNVDKLKEFHRTRGRDCLDCFNRFGEGLLNMVCRRGFKEITAFLLSPEVQLSVRVRDDYGRTPLHDACWSPEPQLDICRWIMQQDPSLFLVADKRGYTPFQYARKSDWHIWRQFLFDNRDLLVSLSQPDAATTFAS